MLPRVGWAEAMAPRAVGDLTVRVFASGARTLPLSTFFADVTRAYLDAAYAAPGWGAAPDEVPTPANVTLIEAPGRRILIDAGGGPNWSATPGRLEDAPPAAGIAPEEITDVVLTHAHPEHPWSRRDGFEEMPRFPNVHRMITATEHAC